jgi:hypothetical protein
LKNENEGGGIMKHQICNLVLFLGQQSDQRRIRVGLIILTVILFVLGAGAPADAGGSG